MIVFGSRGSDLALTQTRAVATALRAATGEEFRVEVIETRGDRDLDRPLPTIGGKGLFTAELEAALLGGRIDAAVHSMKDLPVELREELVIGAVPARAAHEDVLVYDPAVEDQGGAFVPLRAGCRVGTSSHRRRAALALHRKDLEYADVRGNVPTRVAKVRRGEYGAVVLAAAGLDRLDLPLDGLKRLALPAQWCPPAPAQGALAVQCRANDARVRALLAQLHHPLSARCAGAEREVLAVLGGGCSMPLGALVTADECGFRMQLGLFARPDLHPGQSAALFQELRGSDPSSLARIAAAEWAALVGEPLLGVAVTLLRPEGSGSELADALAIAGAKVRTVHLTRIVSLPGVAVSSRRLRDRAIAFSSARAVERFFAIVAPADVARGPVFAAGAATAAAIRARGVACSCPSEGSGGAAMARHVLASALPPGGILYPCAEDRHPEFEAALKPARIAVDPLPLYRSEPIDAVQVPEAHGEWLLFTSPSAVRAYVAAPREGRSRHLALGDTTAAVMHQLLVRCDAVAARPTAASLISCLLESSHA
ncbi:MAG: hydroxymethylbilane synthase [Planctomycetes bacterium]|nr:hydroxymethylbilane synthase [Planctomycetota bacterium]